MPAGGQGKAGAAGNEVEGEEYEGAIEAEDWRHAYLKRPENLAGVSLYDWFLKYRKFKGGGLRLRKHDKIIRIWPAYHPDDPETEDHEQWCGDKLVLHRTPP